MTYEDALKAVMRGEYAKADEVIIEALKKQIPESPLARLTSDNGIEIIGVFCPCCHAVLNRDELYIKRCRCGKALGTMLWDYTREYDNRR